MTDPLGLYLHIPFCAGKCYYCHFYSRVATPEKRQAYVQRLCREIEQWGGRIDRPIDTFYIGGGTPSLLTSEQLCSITDTVRERFRLTPNAEVTLEANPESLDAPLLAAYRAMGINRLSLGVQSADDTLLAAMGRRHTVAQAVRAVQQARQAGFDNISLDFILGLPGETPATAQANAALIRQLRPEHLSLYLFSLEEDTVLARRKDRYAFLDDEALADDYTAFCRMAASLGYRHYEISNFCLDGRVSRHNTRYWTDREYLGIGPAAHSYLTGKRFYYAESLDDFMNGLPPVPDGEGGDVTEWLMLGLRLSEGISLGELARRYSLKPTAAFTRLAERYRRQGLVNFDGDRLSLTEAGMLVSNSLMCDFTEEHLYENL